MSDKHKLLWLPSESQGFVRAVYATLEFQRDLVSDTPHSVLEIRNSDGSDSLYEMVLK